MRYAFVAEHRQQFCVRTTCRCLRTPAVFMRAGGKPAVVVDNTLNRQFDVDAPDTAWVTDITYIKTMDGFADLAAVIDQFSRASLAGHCKAGRPASSFSGLFTWRSGAASRRIRC